MYIAMGTCVSYVPVEARVLTHLFLNEAAVVSCPSWQPPALPETPLGLTGYASIEYDTFAGEGETIFNKNSKLVARTA